MESYPAQLNDVFAIYLHSELPDNINKVPTTRGYYITGETDTGEKDVLPTDFDIKFSFGSENLGSYYDTYKDVIGKEYQINGDITANFCRMESDEAGRFCEFVEFMNGIYAAHV